MPRKFKVGDYVRLASTWECICNDCCSMRGCVLTIVEGFKGNFTLRNSNGDRLAGIPRNHLVKEVFLSAAAHAVKRKIPKEKPDA